MRNREGWGLLLLYLKLVCCTKVNYNLMKDTLVVQWILPELVEIVNIFNQASTVYSSNLSKSEWE